MKLTKYLYAVALGVVAVGFAACTNGERSFSDYEGGTTVYFANQFPVRTLVLGNDEYDNSLDLQHKCAIYATMGGSYKGRKVVLDIAVDNNLCDNLYFTNEDGSAGNPVLPMPANYYSLAGNQIKFNGDLWGCVEVQFTDAFFADPKAIENTYAIPVKITKQTGVDHILTGTPLNEGETPARQDYDSWSVPAKDYVLYIVKYINPWQANYIRRGVDQVTERGNTTQVVRADKTLMESDLEHNHENPVNANDEICKISTVNMTQAVFPVSFKTSGAAKQCELLLSFSGDKCTISSNTEGVTASGSGEYITKGTENPAYKDFQWGSENGVLKQRDILRLEYSVDFGNIQVATKDTLVVRDRETNKKVTFDQQLRPQYIK